MPLMRVFHEASDGRNQGSVDKGPVETGGVGYTIYGNRLPT